jgi:hypothetical protein
MPHGDGDCGTPAQRAAAILRQFDGSNPSGRRKALRAARDLLIEPELEEQVWAALIDAVGAWALMPDVLDTTWRRILFGRPSTSPAAMKILRRSLEAVAGGDRGRFPAIAHYGGEASALSAVCPTPSDQGRAIENHCKTLGD